RAAGPRDPERGGAPADRLGEDHARGRAEGRGSRERRGGCVTVFVGSDTRLVVQGITGREGTFHTLRNRAYGTQVVAGVTPGKAGGDVEGIPVFDTVAEAVAEAGAETSVI